MTEGRPAPRVTVGLPFFNEEEHLGEAIRSVLDQTVEEIEVLLVDDGSTDRSLAIARSFDDPRIVVLSDGTRRHLPARLNEITRRASADVVARMDADDLAHPRRLALQLEMLEREAACDAVGTWTAIVDDDGAILGVNEAVALPGSRRTLETGLISHATMVARRRWLRANPYDERLTRAEDRDLWCRTVGTSAFGVVPLPLYVVRTSHREASFLASYLESQRQNRILFLRYGPRSVGLARTTRLWTMSYLKGIAWRLALASNLTDVLARRRGRPPTAAERALIVEAMRSSRRPSVRPSVSARSD